ncbi:hypothetical protein [Salipiger thiooxidans]|uniref:hypothetical protein n=1 Tax=Salipiger thiooxidans TaxID=282683 RepID=UPI001CD3D5DB|nr:hypothetical protein [Salipiger thiooxidans]MCA0851430.1 hypothetical protein [Salipiger thiooxidans]
MPRTCVSAATPGLPDEPRLSRRSLLTALPAVGTSLAIAMPEQKPSDVMLRFAAWKEARRYASRPDLSEEELNLAVDRMTEIEKELDRLPSTSAQDFAAKLAAYTSFGDFDLPGPSHALMGEMRRLLDS